MKKIPKTELILVLGILLLGGWLRLANPDLTEFKADEARLMKLAIDMAEGKGFALRGISSSVGLPNFPMSVWLYAIPLFISKHPYSPTIFTGLLNLLAIGLTYWMTRRYWGWRVAAVASLLYAVNPWAIHHSRKIWAQNLIAPFVIIWAFSALLVYVDRRPRWLIPHLLALAIAIQCHLAAISLIPATLILFLIYRRDINIKWLIGGGLAGLVTVVPFLIYLFSQTTSLGGSTPNLPLNFGVTALGHARRLSTGAGIAALMGDAAILKPLDVAVSAIIGLLVLIGIARIALNGRAQRQNIILLVWFFNACLFFVWEFSPVFLHYLLPLAAAPMILAGIGITALQRRDTASRVPTLGVIAVLALFQVWAWQGTMGFVTQNGVAGGFGTPLGMQLKAVGEAQAMMERIRADEVLVVGDGEFPHLDHTPAVFDTLLHGTRHRFVDGEFHAVIPARPTVILIAEGDTILYENVIIEERRVPRRFGDDDYIILGINGPPPAETEKVDETLANFVKFSGFTGHDDGNFYPSLQFQWEVGASAEVDYHLFMHLLNSEGEIMAQEDVAAFYSGQWREGDVVLSRFWLDTWEGSVTVTKEMRLRVGMYAYPELTAVPLLDVAGNPKADYLEVSR